MKAPPLLGAWQDERNRREPESPEGGAGETQKQLGTARPAVSPLQAGGDIARELEAEGTKP